MINIEKKDKIEIVSFSVERINALIVDMIREEIMKVIDNPNSRVVINLKGVIYIDSSGFGCFLNLVRTSRNNYGIIKFASPEPSVNSVLETLNLHTVFQLYPDLDSCIRSF